MKLTDRFWTETAPVLSDVALAALLSSLHRRPEEYPVGVLKIGPTAWSETRFAWATANIAAEIAVAPGVSYDPRSDLAVVWEVALATPSPATRPALGMGRKVAATRSSWTEELFRRLGADMCKASLASFVSGYNAVTDGKKMRGAPPMKPRPQADPFEERLASAKSLERALRSEFSEVDDLGEMPTPGDRLAYLRALGLGYEDTDVLDALHGRAEKCRKNRRWRDIDTAQVFLRLTWLCGEAKRFQEAVNVGQSLNQEPESPVVVGKDGKRYFNGMEMFQPEPAPDPNATLAPFDYDSLPPNRWVKKPEPK